MAKSGRISSFEFCFFLGSEFRVFFELQKAKFRSDMTFFPAEKKVFRGKKVFSAKKKPFPPASMAFLA
tara:strand:- start:191 stop:394 length:204 start_codon:yes stop_codon:yes gene_type:complete